ncbi:expressed unknown protein [Seminavis robusta]|uniref:Uncharacterized protein n=1 Tax=Seminavis robusta TaxID=568900 RepID=A0A9N8HD39_9STRA|nr:expressed unknown protein [Seminavis robusta]|eukprot:Sro408_g136890.1 n/a (324) ;mRNA; r:23139-24229
MVAFLGTLRLLGPMVFARRVLAQGGELVSDYMMGRYMRTTFDHWERKYWKEYQGPAATRSCGRCFIHAAILMLLGKLMEWMIRPDNPPCLIPQTGACHWWCGLLWVVSVVGTGNFFAALISTRGPVKIKMTKSAMPNNLHHQKRRRRLFLTRPLQVLKGLRDPDHWLTSIATLRRNNANLREPFTPEPLLFPSTWPPFSMLRNFAIAKAMASSSQANSMHVIMRQFLIMHALLDEWHRVLMDERRVGLGLCIIATGFIAMCFLFVTVALTDNVSAVLLVPYLLATFGSGWMNLFCFWERRRNHERDLVVMRHGRQERRYSIKW